MPADPLTPRNRLLAALRGDDVDRVPISLEGFITQPTLDDERDPAKREILSRLIGQQHFFVTWPSHTNRWLMTPTQRIRSKTAKKPNGDTVSNFIIDTPKGPLTAVTWCDTTTATTWTTKYPVESREDIERIRSVPWELPEGLAPADDSALPGGFAERGILCTRVSSPFVCVAGMMSYEAFLELCVTDFDLVRELTDVCLDRTLAALDVVLARRNVDYVWMGGCEWLTPPMGSPRLYGELVQEYERKVIARAHRAGAFVHVHCHGKVRSTLEKVIERGADFFEPVEPPPDGDLPFAEAKALAKGRMTLGGNVEARVLEYGDPEEVERAARAAFEGGKRRMVFQASVGPISALTPRALANYHRLVDVWEELSPL